MTRVGARGHVTFGGRLEKDARGLIAGAMAKKRAGDWRDPERIRAWGQEMGRAILAEPPRVRVPHRQSAPLRWILATLCLFAGLTAIGGGLALLAAPDGSIVRMPLSILEHTPFRDFLVPGLLLTFVVGFGNMIAGALVARRYRFADAAAFMSGGALTIWILVQMIMLRSAVWLQLGYLALGLVIQGLALVRARQMRERVPGREPLAGRRLPPEGPIPHTP
jgi:hypothetical protein